MKRKAAETALLAAKAAEMTDAGWSTRAIGDELGVSAAWVSRHKKSASTGQAEAQDDDSTSESSTNSDDTTSDENEHVILTAKQKKYIDELKQRKMLYNDTAEGWMVQLSEAAYKAAGSVMWWTAIVYPESAPEGWEDRLDATGMAWSKSPLHDKDKWNHDSPAGAGNLDGKPHYFAKGEAYKAGDAKKAHWHICGKLDKPMKYKELCKLIQDITHGTVPQECISLTGYYDYMTHLKNPDKYPYYKEAHNEDHNGFMPEMNSAERKKWQAQIIRTIHVEGLDTWGKLMKAYVGSPELLDVIASKHGFFKNAVDHEYYKAHPESRLQYGRKQMDAQNKELVNQRKEIAGIKEAIQTLTDLVADIARGDGNGND